MSTSLNLNIELIPTSVNLNREPIQNTAGAGLSLRDNVQMLVANPEDMEGFYPLNQTPNQTHPYEYLIVTTNQLRPIYQDLANWKTIKGIRATILTVEEIQQNYSGYSLPMKIKNALKDYYDGSQNGLKYVLMGTGNDSTYLSCYVYYYTGCKH